MRRRFALLWHSPTFTSWLSLLVRFGSVVLLLPVVLVRFSAAEVGVWQLFSALFVLSLMLDYAMAPTFSRLLSFARGGLAVADMVRVGSQRPAPSTDTVDTTDSARRIFATMRWLYPRLALLVTGLMALLGTWALHKPVAELADPAQAWIAWVLVLVAMLVTVWGGSFSHALQGMNRIAPMRRWDVVFGTLQMVTSVSVLAAGGNLLALVATYQAWAVIGALRNRMLLRRLHPALFGGAARRDAEALQAAWPATWRTLISVLGSHGVVQLSGVLYSQTLPAAELASYLLALRLATVVSQFAQAPFYTKLPRLAELHAAGQTAQVLDAAARGMRLAHWVFVAGALVAAFGAPWVISLLRSNTEFVTPLAFALLVLGMFAERLGAMHLQMYSLTNHIVTHRINGLTGALTCLATVLLLPRAGMLAFPLAMLAVNVLVYCPMALHYSRRAFPGGFRRFERRTSAGPLALLLAGLAFSAVLLRP